MKTTNNTTNTNTTPAKVTTTPAPVKNSSAIEFKACARKNERVLVYDIRCAIIDRNDSALLSLCKAWIHMVDNGVVSDADVMALVRELKLVSYNGKYASVKGRKDGKEGELNVLSSGRVKAWLYTVRRNGYKVLSVNAEKGDRPEEKEARSISRKTTVKISKEDREMLELIKKMRDAGMNKEAMAKVFEVMAC